MARWSSLRMLEDYFDPIGILLFHLHVLYSIRLGEGPHVSFRFRSHRTNNLRNYGWKQAISMMESGMHRSMQAAEAPIGLVES